MANVAAFLIIGLLAIIFIWAVYEFLKTPHSERYVLFTKQVKLPGVEYAPEYSAEDKKKHVVRLLIIGFIVYLLSKFWYFPWLGDYAKHAHQYCYGLFSGVHLLFYGIFVLMPLAIAVLFFFLGGRQGLAAIKTGQMPAPGVKVYVQTPIKRGMTVKIVGYFTLMSVIACVGLALWGGFQAYELTRDIKPCATQETNSG